MIVQIILSCILVVIWAFICTGFMKTESEPKEPKDPKMYTYVYNPLGLIAFNVGFLAGLFYIWQ